MDDRLDGLLTFFASHHAIRAEKSLRNEELAAMLIPGPKELSPNCGVAVRFEYATKDRALALLAAKKVQVDEVHRYRPDTDDWQGQSRPTVGMRRFWRRGGSEG